MSRRGRGAAAWLALLLLALALVGPARALAAASVAPTPTPIEIVLDTSGSMSESDGSPSGRIKIDGAKVALLDFLQQVEPQTPLGLRNYPGSGTQEGPDGCSAGDAQFEVRPRDPAEMAATIRTLHADGDTPTAAALEAAAEELRETGSDQGTIVLVSDGESNCGPDPCETAREIAESGIDLQTITVGFRVSGAGARQLRCIAEQTEGEYLSVHDNAGLAEAFDEISRPKLELHVSFPTLVTAEVGNDPSGLVRIDAEVSNVSQQQARGVMTRLRFDAVGGSPGVIRPVVYLGNLEPGESRKVSWTFRPGVPPSDQNPLPLPFSVLAGAQNTLQDAEFRGTVRVRDAYEDAGDAGPILASRRRIAILGDSFSAGEGADAYIAGTDTTDNHCHRSLRTYLAPAFSLPAADIIACSGAVTGDVTAPQPGNAVTAQTDQLEALGKKSGFDAVVMTLGGNNIGFSKIAKSCLLGRVDCSQKIFENVFWQVGGIPSNTFVDNHFKPLAGDLNSAYRAINQIANAPTLRARHGPVPILVLGYPLPTPLSAQSCRPMLNQLSGGEIDFLDRLLIRLNGTIQGAVDQARSEGVPAFFIPNTEMAFQPDHTLCDKEPYARTLTSFNGAGVDGSKLLGAVKQVVWPFSLNPLDRIKGILGIGKAGMSQVERSLQELVHPNALGYAAETRAILRWSQSPAAATALQLLGRTPPAPSPTVTVTASGPDLGQLAPGSVPTLQGGSVYPLNLQGFAAGSVVTVSVHSEVRALAELAADSSGAVSAEIGLPADLEPGEHTLIVSGVGGDGQPHSVEARFRIAGTGAPTVVTALLWGGIAMLLLAGLGGLAVLVMRRRGGPAGVTV
ncbi:MAG: VWA domain-containing protein [Solirubrobacterales bacterium]